MRRYYKRLLRQVLVDVRAYFRKEIMTGTILGVVAALISRTVGWIPRGGILWTVLVALLPNSAIMVAALIVNAVRAPVKLDNQRRSRAQKQREAAERRLFRDREKHQRELTELAQEKAGIEEKLKVGPLEQSRRELVAGKLTGCNPEDRMVLEYLILHGSTYLMALQRNEEIRSKTQNAFAAESAINRCVNAQLITQVPGATEMVEVNPELKNAVEFHLFVDPPVPKITP
jgi:hypothetical protein